MSLLDPKTDFFGVFADVDGEDLEHWKRAAEYGRIIAPHVDAAWETATYRTDLVARAAEFSLLTDGVSIKGQPEVSPLAVGLAYMELGRVDLSFTTALAVQAGLALRSVAMCGSEEQKAQWLPALAKAEKLGSFALTEPDHGSDSIALETSAVRDGDQWVINGAKRWIGQGAVGDITVVWARTEEGDVSGFLVDQSTPGYEAKSITGKMSLRGIPQADITLNNVRIPSENQLPGARTFRDTAEILSGTRASVAWASLGAAIGCYERALEYASERVQFGKKLIQQQVVQQRLSDMLQDLTSMALYCRRMADLHTSEALRGQQASLAKVHNTRKARAIAANARDLLGGNGILLENKVGRMYADIEALHTYEGTDTIQSLIVGKDITGVSAYR